MWEPSNSSNIVSLSENTIYYIDCNTSIPKVMRKLLKKKQNNKIFNCFLF